jgi:hypothetical protein
MKFFELIDIRCLLEFLDLWLKFTIVFFALGIAALAIRGY